MEHTVGDILRDLRAGIASRIGPSRFRTWFDLVTFQLTDSSLELCAPNEFVGKWISSNYLPAIRETVRELTGREAPVRIAIVPSAPDSAAPRRVAPRPAKVPTTFSQRAEPLRGTFETFVVGRCNQLAFAAAKSVVHSTRRGFQPIVLHGNNGLGKTHLLQAICNAFIKENPSLAWRYTSGEEFCNEFITSVTSRNTERFRNRLRAVDVLVIDDVHFLADKRATQREFLHTFNAIELAGKAIVMSTDRHPRDIVSLSEPVLDRLVSGMVVEVNSPEFNVRREILRRKAEALNCPVTDDALDFLARSIVRNVRELEGAMIRLVAVAAMNREPVSIDLAKRALDDFLRRSVRTPETADVENAVTQVLDVPRETLRARSRSHTTQVARALLMCVLRRKTEMSYPEIARALGSKSHSNVLAAVRRIEGLIETRQTVSWKSNLGPRETPAIDLVEQIENCLPQRP